MFDIGFWELMVLAIIGIVVVGPEKLPGVVRQIIAMLRKIRRMFNDVRSDIERELEIDEMRRIIHDSEVEQHIEDLNRSIMSAHGEITHTGKTLLDEIDQEINHDVTNTQVSRTPTPSRVPSDPGPVLDQVREQVRDRSQKPPLPAGISNDLAAAKYRAQKRQDRDAILDEDIHFDGESYRDTGVEPPFQSNEPMR